MGRMKTKAVKLTLCCSPSRYNNFLQILSVFPICFVFKLLKVVLKVANNFDDTRDSYFLKQFLSKKKYSANCSIFPLQFCVRRVTVTTTAIKDIAIVLDCSLELYGKTLSLRTPCTFIIELGEIKLVVTRKLPHS